MRRRVPNLWRRESKAARLYELYIAELLISNRHADIVAACRKIRSYTRDANRQAAMFTYSHEIDALCALGKHAVAWQQLRRRDRELEKVGELKGRKWGVADPWSVRFDYAPLLYFTGRYEEGCGLLEAALGTANDRNVPSYDLLFSIYNGELRPKLRPRVTLTHFYKKLGKSLRDWEHWAAFLDGLSPRLFRVGRIRREELLEHPERLGDFFKTLMAVRAARMTSGITRGEQDLIESSRDVKKWQDDTRLRLEKFRRKQAASEWRTKMRRSFPDLGGR